MMEWLRDLQDRGYRLGLYPGPGDGVHGPATQRMFNSLFAAAEKAKGVTLPPAVYPNLPLRYQWLLRVGTLPLMTHEALKLLGVKEVPGKADNPEIMRWIQELQDAGYETAGLSDDAVPWCGSYMAYVALQARKEPPRTFAWARSWAKFGVHVEKHEAALGDVLVWARGSGGHVNSMIGVDNQGFYHGVGGNQRDGVNIMRKHPNSGLLAVRRPIYRVQPASVKQYRVSAAGEVSRDEQ